MWSTRRTSTCRSLFVGEIVGSICSGERKTTGGSASALVFFLRVTVARIVLLVVVFRTRFFGISGSPMSCVLAVDFRDMGLVYQILF